MAGLRWLFGELKGYGYTDTKDADGKTKPIEELIEILNEFRKKNGKLPVGEEYDGEQSFDVEGGKPEQRKRIAGALRLYAERRRGKNSNMSDNDLSYDKIITKKIEKVYGKKLSAMIAEKVASASPEIIALWCKYADRIKFSRLNLPNGKGFFDSKLKTISLCKDYDASPVAEFDKKSVRFEILFHEIGHLFDFKANERHGGLDYKSFSEDYGNGSFADALREETEEYLYKTHFHMKMSAECFERQTGHIQKEVLYEDVYKFVSDELRQMNFRSACDISDILESVTMHAIRGPAGHKDGYWKDHDIGTEAFASMFSASIVNPESLKQIQVYFPKAYGIFCEMLRRM
ncbi:MAG: hypothetical protein LBT55_01675 [Clostridiaceae bacterium]|jgi:hypothetical protein|nr:hypothetical protein [Clostridiaceae bacterium]